MCYDWTCPRYVSPNGRGTTTPPTLSNSTRPVSSQPFLTHPLGTYHSRCQHPASSTYQLRVQPLSNGLARASEDSPRRLFDGRRTSKTLNRTKLTSSQPTRFGKQARRPTSLAINSLPNATSERTYQVSKPRSPYLHHPSHRSHHHPRPSAPCISRRTYPAIPLSDSCIHSRTHARFEFQVSSFNTHRVQNIKTSRYGTLVNTTHTRAFRLSVGDGRVRRAMD